MKTRHLFIALASVLLGTGALSAQETATPAPTGKTSANKLAAHIEMHDKLALAHKNAAECLKSGKPTQECQNQFRQETQGMREMKGMGKGKGKGKGHGMHHHHGMDAETESTPAPTSK